MLVIKRASEFVERSGGLVDHKEFFTPLKLCRETKIQLFNDHFQNYKRYGIPKAQLVIADIPYNLGKMHMHQARHGTKAEKLKMENRIKRIKFFDTDENFRISEFMHFCSKMLKKEPKEVGKAPAMIVFCAFQQLQMVIDYGKSTALTITFH